MQSILKYFRLAIKIFRRDIRAVLNRDPAARSSMEVIFCYPGFHAMIFHRTAHFLWSRHVYLMARWLSHLGRFLTGIEISSSTDGS